MRKHFSDLVLASLALLPFCALYVVHFTQSAEATGFIQYDLPYYSANGREVFERGNGFSAVNPYDADPSAPAIYFQWYPWLLGIAIKKLHLGPEFVFVGTGFVAAWLTSWFTLQIMHHLVENKQLARIIFLLAMWGGGLLCLAQVTINVANARAPWQEILYFDIGAGWWFFSWGRNLLLPTEAVYHALVAATWLAVLTRNEWRAVALTTALAATHQFSGVQHLLVLGSWNLFQLLAWRDKQALFRGLTLTAVLGAFLAYYFVFLEGFPQHRELRETWSLDWSVPSIVLMLAYGPVAVLALKRITTNHQQADVSLWFFVTATIVSFALIKHDLLINPHQPLHFTRGYVWMPLFLIAVPVMERFLSRLLAIENSIARWIALSCVFLVACFDNLCFLSATAQHNPKTVKLPVPVRQIFAEMEANDMTGVFLCSDETVSYLSATFTPVRPYFGHKFNTPEFAKRKTQVAEWSLGNEPDAWFETVDLIMLTPKEPVAILGDQNWKLDADVDGYRLFQRN